MTSSRRAFLVNGAALAVAGPALAAPLPTPSFAYDAGAAPVVTYGPDRTVAPGVIARDVTFVSTTGHKVTGGQLGQPFRLLRLTTGTHEG